MVHHIMEYLIREITHKILSEQSIFREQQHPSYLNNNNKSMRKGVEFGIRQTGFNSQPCH